MVVQLPHANMPVDPRRMGLDGDEGGSDSWEHYSFSVSGRTLTITRTDKDTGWGDAWSLHAFSLRAYLPTEVIPDFTSTVYTYWGLRGEYVPKDTTDVIFAPSATTIREYAFDECQSLVRVKIPDHITEIEKGAFFDCVSLKSLQLPCNLTSIGLSAFRQCKSLEAVYLPPTATNIHYSAFKDCASLRFFFLPHAIEVLGDGVVDGCDQLLTTVRYEYDDYTNIVNNDEVNQWLMQRHAHFHLHQACCSTFVTPQKKLLLVLFTPAVAFCRVCRSQILSYAAALAS